MHTIQKYYTSKTGGKIVFEQLRPMKKIQDLFLEMIHDPEQSCYAFSVEKYPRKGNLSITHAMTRSAIYYLGEHVVSLQEARQSKEFAPLAKKCDPREHKAIVKCRGNVYAMLKETDVVIDKSMNQIWPPVDQLEKPTEKKSVPLNLLAQKRASHQK